MFYDFLIRDNVVAKTDVRNLLKIIEFILLSRQMHILRNAIQIYHGQRLAIKINAHIDERNLYYIFI